VDQPRLRFASGLDALDLATDLLHRVRLADATAGVWEAADLQWWWRTPRRSDELKQLFWLDDDGPVAAALLTDWTRTWGFDPIVVPGASRAVREAVWSAGVARIEELSLGEVEALVRDDDQELIAFLGSAGFEPTEDRGAATWMDAADRPRVAPLPDGFVLLDRLHPGDRPHPLVGRSGALAEARLNPLGLYDPELDLSIQAPTGEIASYALFWFDPVTGVGLVEPMRTEDAWQRRGLARAILANGLDRLARKGARRLKVSFATPAGRGLYVGAGFQIGEWTTNFVRRAVLRGDAPERLPAVGA